MRVIIRRERPHPGAQLSLFEEADGWRYQAFATNTAVGQLAFLEARHRAHARVEDRIRHAKDSGLGRFPSREFAINQAWLQVVADRRRPDRLAAPARPARRPRKPCEPKALRYRLLHVPARLTRGGRRRRLRLPATGPGPTRSSTRSTDHGHPSTDLTRGPPPVRHQGTSETRPRSVSRLQPTSTPQERQTARLKINSDADQTLS